MSTTDLQAGGSDNTVPETDLPSRDPDHNTSPTDLQSCDAKDNVDSPTYLESRDPDNLFAAGDPGETMEALKPTIVEAVIFDAESAAAKLRKAMKGLGTDENIIISILCEHSNAQRQIIKEQYKTAFGRDLAEDLKSELSGHFLDLCLFMLMPSRYFDAFSLRRAMEGVGTNEDTLIEILVSRTNEQINEIKEVYKNELFNRDLEDDIVSETSGDFKRVLVSLLSGNRDESEEVNEEQVTQDKEALYEAGVGTIMGTDEDVFNRIFVTRSKQHLQRVFTEYRNYDTQDIEAAIQQEMSGDAQQAFLSIAQFMRDPIDYYACCFEASFAGPLTNDDRLMQLTVSHSEVDLGSIAEMYQQKYEKSLKDGIRSETSGDYRKLLLRILDPSKLH